ncbi:MAG: SEC-C domain-containing protein, partial [Chloroflexi bacterium]|nr:SEC-C domain-containing protein [Chloroflexota bacterium]
KLGMEEDTPIEHGMVSKAIEQAQSKVEGFHFDMRKHAVEFDDVMNEHRRVIYGERQKILKKEDLKDSILDMVREELNNLVATTCADDYQDNWDTEALLSALKPIFPVPEDFNAEELKKFTREELLEVLEDAADKAYEAKEAQMTAPLMRHIERLVLLRIIDTLWVEHLTTIDDLREGIGLRAYGQQDPLVAYKAEAYDLFQSLMGSIQHDVVHTIYNVNIIIQPMQPPAEQIESGPAPQPSPEPAGAVQNLPREVPRPSRVVESVAPAPAQAPAPPAGNGASSARQAARAFGSSPYANASTNREEPAARKPVAAAAAKVGRNDPCPCGSGLKYKRCHGKAA